MMHKLILIATAMILLTLTSAKPVAAATAPNFPSCEQANGTVIVQYDSGTHGIPGRTESYTGSDSVYRISDTQVLQCFCPEEGSEGIQSNWWKYQGLTEDEDKIFTRTGWTFVVDGTAWGLDRAPYLVQNKSYSCRGVGGGTVGSSGQVLGVTSLADTGDSLAIFSLLGVGALALVAARKK